GFEALPSRLTTVGTIDAVEFVDDSLSTNVLPTCAAVRSFPGRTLALIVGGFDRGIDYAPLAEALADRTAPTLVIGVPDNGARIVEELRAAGIDASTTAVADSIESAVRTGFDWLRRDGGVVLLSPAAASYGRYGNYQERADAFVAAMRSL
ncbi:MAG TPA: hypothetical protein VF183_13505, partial [Acidimicrobiales bacterium]